eukprot:COSAG04_NODE_2083_length_4835_cov_2.135980_3_plen_213_part_00
MGWVHTIWRSSSTSRWALVAALLAASCSATACTPTPRHSCHVKPQRPSLEPQRCVAAAAAAAAAVAERTVRRCASAWRQMEMRSSLSSVPSTSCNTSTPSASDPSTSKHSGEVKDQSEICHQEVNNGDQKPPGETRGLSSTVCSGETSWALPACSSSQPAPAHHQPWRLRARGQGRLLAVRSVGWGRGWRGRDRRALRRSLPPQPPGAPTPQ